MTYDFKSTSEMTVR